MFKSEQFKWHSVQLFCINTGCDLHKLTPPPYKIEEINPACHFSIGAPALCVSHDQMFCFCFGFQCNSCHKKRFCFLRCCHIYIIFFFLLNPSNVRVTGNGSRSFTSRVCLYVCSFLPEAALLCFLMRSGDHPPLSDLRETIHYQEKVYLYYCIVNGNDMLIVNGTMGTVGSLTRTHTQTHILGCISHMLTCTHTV